MVGIKNIAKATINQFISGSTKDQAVSFSGINQQPTVAPPQNSMTKSRRKPLGTVAKDEVGNSTATKGSPDSDPTPPILQHDPAADEEDEDSSDDDDSADGAGDAEESSEVSPREARIQSAATFRKKAKSLKQLRPKDSHYEELRPTQLRQGYIYRLNTPDNSTMDLQTFVVVKVSGRSCALLRIIRNDSREREMEFEQHHVRILKKDQDDKLPLNKQLRYRVEALMKGREEMHNDCWVNVERPFDMGDDGRYMVAYCGELTTESKKWLYDEHMRQYGAQ